LLVRVDDDFKLLMTQVKKSDDEKEIVQKKLENLEKKSKCTGCNKVGLKKCKSCKAVYYCSIECQKKDWKNHKVNCKATPKDEK